MVAWLVAWASWLVVVVVVVVGGGGLSGLGGGFLGRHDGE